MIFRYLCCCSRTFAEIIVKTLNRKHLDINTVVAVGMKSSKVKLLFPTIASTPAPPTEQLLIEHVSLEL